MLRRSYHQVAHVFWNADSWLPKDHDRADIICTSLSRSLAKKQLSNCFLTVYAAAEKFSEEHVLDAFYQRPEFGSFETDPDNESGRLHRMLVDLVFSSSADGYRGVDVVAVAKLSKDSSVMICRVLASLIKRGYNVFFALPEVESATSVGITLCESHAEGSVPVWVCPDLFSQVGSDSEHGDSKSCFIVPPAPEQHALDFTMPADADTCVFWDVHDYPPPAGFNLSTFRDKIREAVVSRSRVSPRPTCTSPGNVWVYAYVVNDEDFPLDAPSGIKLTVVRNAPADNLVRLAKITRDFLFWSIDNPTNRRRPQPRRNLLVISKPWEHDTLYLRKTLVALECRGYNVCVARRTEEIPVAPESFKYFSELISWERLSEPATGKHKREEDDHSPLPH